MALVEVYQEVVLLITEKESKVILGYTIALGAFLTGLFGFVTTTFFVSILVQEVVYKINRNRIFYIS